MDPETRTPASFPSTPTPDCSTRSAASASPPTTQPACRRAADVFVVGGGTVGPSALHRAVLARRRFTLLRHVAAGPRRCHDRLDRRHREHPGGYDGPSLDAEVLATTDGLGFTKVAMLPLPVRYPELPHWRARFDVFGGNASDGRPVRSVQVINPITHTASLIGDLPIPLRVPLQQTSVAPSISPEANQQSARAPRPVTSISPLTPPRTPSFAVARSRSP